MGRREKEWVEGSEKSHGKGNCWILFKLMFLDGDRQSCLMVRSTELGARLPGINLCSFLVILGRLLMLLVLQLSHLRNGNVNGTFLLG